MSTPTHDTTSSSGNGRSPRPRTVLVLGGGGPKGVAHLGVVRALEKLDIVPDEIVGTSVGAVIGAAMAAGMGSSDLQQLVSDIPFEDYFRVNLLRALVSGSRTAPAERGERYREFLSSRLPVHEFDQLSSPFFCNALSLSTGSMRYFGLPGAPRVGLIDAVYASSCLPGVFEPREIEGELYVDGGMAESMGLRVADARRPDLILAVDVSTPDQHQPMAARPAPTEILYQTFQILGRAVNEHNLHRYANRSDLVLIKPRLADVDAVGAAGRVEAMSRGESEAYRALVSHPRTRYLCDPEFIKSVDRSLGEPREYVHLDVDPDACINCGICAVTCVTGGYAAVPLGSVVRKLHHYECTRDGACERSCPTRAITLGNL